MASMQPEEAVAFMKQARCNALYVAKTRTPDKFADVQARWEEEWKEFGAWQRTQGPPASSASKATSRKGQYESSEEEWRVVGM